MKKVIAAGAAALMLSAGSANALVIVPVLNFDQAYTVAAPLSTVAVSDFSIDGPAPWLFVDLPQLGSLFTTVNSKWFKDGVVAAQFTVVPNTSNADQFWLSPTPAAWNAKKAAGPWHIDATFDLTGIQFAENGGIGVGVSEGTGSTTVAFNVVPLPACGWLVGLAFGALRLRRRSIE